ncbi:MAG: sugar ABC transporter permease [Anaerolineae bacterium]|nr:sugar ABC transporter permease [Anaerolineae bacterium]
MYPTQHCTYIDGAPRLEYRFGLFVTVGSALLILLPVWALLFKDRTTIKEVSTSGYFRNPVLPYLFLSPTLFILIVFLYYPGSQVLTLSTKLKRFPLPQERFSCMANYVKLTEDPIYQNSFSTTIFFTVMIVILSMFLALMIAILASQKIKGASVYRSLLIWPYAVSPIVTAIVFLTMFREGGAGLINYALDNLFGLEPRWLTDTDLAPWVVILAAVWNSLGFNILFYIAGLQNVPEDLLEAAAIDGANRIQKFIRITFPLLSPFTFFLLITNITYSFYGIYGAVEALTQGGPTLGAGGKDGGATNVLIYKLYQDAFVNGRSGEAAAQALILFLMVAGLTVLQFRFVERRVTYSG